MYSNIFIHRRIVKIALLAITATEHYKTTPSAPMAYKTQSYVSRDITVQLIPNFGQNFLVQLVN